MSYDYTGTGKRRLPVMRTVLRAAELMWIYRWLHLRILLPSFLMLFVSFCAASHWVVGVPPDKLAQTLSDIPIKYVVPWFIASSGGTILMIMFSVSWRRFLLLDRPPSAVIFSRPFRRYLVAFVCAYFFVLFVGLILTNFLLFGVQLVGINASKAPPALGATCMLAAIAIALLGVTRFILLFTAIAIENDELKIKDAIALMDGNTLRFAAAWIGITLSINCANNILLWIPFDLLGVVPASVIGSLLLGVINVISTLGTVSLTTALAALTYDFLVNGGGPRDA